MTIKEQLEPMEHHSHNQDYKELVDYLLADKHIHKWLLAKYEPSVVKYSFCTDPFSIWICECGAQKEVKHNEKDEES